MTKTNPLMDADGIARMILNIRFGDNPTWGIVKGAVLHKKGTEENKGEIMIGS